MIKVFQTSYDFEGFTEGGMKSGNLYYVIEDKSVHFTTNNIDGISRNYGIGVGDDIVPEGNIDLTVNGNNIDVSSYATASVNVPIPAGYIQPSGNYDITVNGNYDVSSYATAYINVASGGGSDADLIDLIEGDATTFNIPSGTTSIRDSAFYKCSSIQSITIPDSVTLIKQYAFGSCSGLTSITIPSGVTSIGNSAFYNCTGLKSVTIGSGVTSIGESAFLLCSTLASVTVLATTPPTLDSNNVFQHNASGRKIYVPAASVEAYKAAWSTYAADIEAIPSN